jgi:molybdopterin molybdotransferase
MLSAADAEALVLARVAALPSIGVERVALGDARGRVLAAAVVAARPLPGFDNAAMDGYAVRAADVPGTLPIASAVAAGATRVAPLVAGTAARILTGAPMPPGADAVVLQEDVEVVGARVTLPAATHGENVRRAGEDVAIGELAVCAGVRLGVGELGLLAALGAGEVAVGRAPRVAVIATGDELVDVSVAPQPGQLVDSSAYALAAAIADAGGTVVRREIVRDDAAAIAAAVAAALRDCDAVVTTGGVSVGDRDHVRAALAAAGCRLEAWKVAMKPGKPFAFGHDGRAPVFGLPGNPVSAVVAFELFVRPALLAMQGAAVVTRSRAPVALASGYRKAAGRAHYLRARVTRDDGQLVARTHAKQGSAMLSSLVGCNALVEIAADVTAVRDGELAPALLLEAV